MGNSNCSKCCKGDLFADEIDLKAPVTLIQGQWKQVYTKDTLTTEPKMHLPNTILSPRSRIGYTDPQILYICRFQALWRGYIERKQYNFMKSLSSPKHKYFSKNDLLMTLKSQTVQLPISFAIEHKSFTYPSGAVYSGEWFLGFRHGSGSMKWPDGCSYKGQWSFGYPNGKGSFTYFDSETFEGRWQSLFISLNDGFAWLSQKHEIVGNFEETHNKLSQELTVKYNEILATLDQQRSKLDSKLNELDHYETVEIQPGIHYQGETTGKNKRQGFGRTVWENGDIYEGGWVNDMQNAWGRNKWVDGSDFFGTYKDTLKHGLGSYRWEDGSSFTGQWAENLMQGVGKYVWADAREYLGEWKEGAMNGFGSFTWPYKRKYVGFWVAGKKEGVGLSIDKDRKTHIDIWMKGKVLRKKN